MTYILLVGSFPFPLYQQEDEHMLVESIKEGQFNWDPLENCSAEGIDFVKGLLKMDPRQRSTAEQALKHPWIRE